MRDRDTPTGGYMTRDFVIPRLSCKRGVSIDIERFCFRVWEFPLLVSLIIVVICPPFLLLFWVALAVWNTIQPEDFFWFNVRCTLQNFFPTLAFRIHRCALCTTSLNQRGANNSELIQA